MRRGILALVWVGGVSGRYPPGLGRRRFDGVLQLRGDGWLSPGALVRSRGTECWAWLRSASHRSKPPSRYGLRRGCWGETVRCSRCKVGEAVTEDTVAVGVPARSDHRLARYRRTDGDMIGSTVASMLRCLRAFSPEPATPSYLETESDISQIAASYRLETAPPGSGGVYVMPRYKGGCLKSIPPRYPPCPRRLGFLIRGAREAQNALSKPTMNLQYCPSRPPSRRPPNQKNHLCAGDRYRRPCPKE